MAGLTKLVPTPFLWRRIHSFTGLFLVLFLFEHLFTNSQATFLLGEDGAGFIRSVNFIHSLPYLPAVELLLLALPFAVHILWGIAYALTANPNSGSSDGRTPSIPTPRNKAYSWQRITAWLLIVGVIWHVAEMRFFHAPTELHLPGETAPRYLVGLDADPGFDTVANRLAVQLTSSAEPPRADKNATPTLAPLPGTVLAQRTEQTTHVEKLLSETLKEHSIAAIAPDFGTAELLVVRDLFRSPTAIALYALFVLAAAFHGCNGLWTFTLSWGLVIHPTAQRLVRIKSLVLMAFLLFFGWSATAVYWLNLRN